jgi:iron(III) transport system substrate-binding protein
MILRIVIIEDIGVVSNMVNKKLVSLVMLIMVLILTSVLAGCGNSESESTATETPATPGEVNLYTTRHYDTDESLYKLFTETTGIKVNVVKGEAAELIERLEREGDATEADLFMAVDAGNLFKLKEKGLSQPIESETINSQVPENFRDNDNHWVGLTKRARVIVYAKDRVNPSELSTYEALTDAKWQGKVLTRSSSNIYSQSLIASFIEINGVETTKAWASGIVANMAREPKGGDRDQAKAIAAGEGDVAIMNTYYIGQMLNSTDPEEVKVATQMGIFFPNQETSGTHVNVSGIVLTKHANNKESAIKFVEFLSSAVAQRIFADTNYEYPVNPEVEPSALLQSWGTFKEQEIALSILGENNAEAIKIMNEVGWK